MGKHYHICFDSNLVHGICEIFRVSCACVLCTSILDKPWVYGTQSTKQTRYQPVKDCNYWPVLVPNNNWNIIHLTPKSIPSEAFDDKHPVVLDGISENMTSLVQSGTHGAINTDYTTANGFYLIQFL